MTTQSSRTPLHRATPTGRPRTGSPSFSARSRARVSRSPTSSAGSRSRCSSATMTPTRKNVARMCTGPAAACSRTPTTPSRTCSSTAGSTTTSLSPSTAASITGGSAPVISFAKGSAGTRSARARPSGSSPLPSRTSPRRSVGCQYRGACPRPRRPSSPGTRSACGRRGDRGAAGGLPAATRRSGR